MYKKIDHFLKVKKRQILTPYQTYLKKKKNQIMLLKGSARCHQQLLKMSRLVKMSALAAV